MRMKRNPEMSLVLQAAKDSHRPLAERGLWHVIIGGLAVHLHGVFDRKARDVDLLIRPEDVDAVKEALLSAQYTWHNFRRACVSANGVRVEPHWNGKTGGRKGKRVTLHFPCPATLDVVDIDGLPVIALRPLIETKLECEPHTLDGRESKSKHREDVLTLIRLNNLTESFGESLSASNQARYRQIVRESQALSH